MSKLAVAFFGVAFLTVSVSSQGSNLRPSGDRCNLTESTSPVARGLRLGYTTEQLLALFPRATKRKEIKSVVDRARAGTGDEAVFLVFDAATDGDAKQFDGVESVSAGVYKGRVVEFTIQYVGTTGNTIDDWVTKLSTTFNLPGPPEWKVGLDEAPNKFLDCDRVLIEAAIQGGGASLRVRSANYLKEIQDRAAATEAKMRRDVKP